jgi:hypothetical protein
MEKLKSLELKKLILEIELIEMDENYSKEFVSNYRPKFNKHLRDISPEFFQKTNQSEATPPPPTDNTESEESEVNEISEGEKAKIKKIYKEISKLCHPDKSNDKTLNELYVEAKFAYEKNDLIAFYFTKLMDHPCHSTFPNLDQLHSLELHVIKNFLSNQKPVDEILKRMLNLI